MKDEITVIGSKSYMKCKVVMLPAEQSTGIFTGILKGIENSRLSKSLWNSLSYSVAPSNGYVVDMWQPQHLYICSQEEIKEGDWCIHVNYSLLHNIHGVIGSVIGSAAYLKRTCLKVIASTDPSLGLPRPSNEFLQRYCELGGIDEVLLEHIQEASSYESPGCDFPDYEWNLKVAPDNTITIRPIKDSWNREEVIAIIHEAFIFDYHSIPELVKDILPKITEWFNKHH